MNEEKEDQYAELARRAYYGIAGAPTDGWTAAAQAVIQHFIKTSLGGVKYVLVPVGEAKVGDEWLKFSGCEWTPVNGKEKFADFMAVRRPISLTPASSSAPKEVYVAVTACASPEPAWTPKFKVGDEVQICNPHHDWDNGMKKIGKVLTERRRYVLADDPHETSWPESALKPFSWPGVEKSDADKVPRSQFNVLLESRAGAIKHVEMLTAERDQLRKEVEELKGKLLYAENEWLKVWMPTAEARGEEARRQYDRAEAAEAQLSRFSWKPVSTPPTEADASRTSVGKCVVWGNDRGEWMDPWDCPFIKWQYPPTHWRHINFPSPPESEEDRVRNDFEEWWYRNADRVGVHSTVKAVANHVWQAVKSQSNK